VLENMEMDSAPAGSEAENRKGLKNRNNPMQALAWTKSYQIPGGRKGQAFCTTLGSSLDLMAEGTRKLVVNAVFWSLGEKVIDPDVRIVDTFEPSAFKTHPKKYWERLKQLSTYDDHISRKTYGNKYRLQGCVCVCVCVRACAPVCQKKHSYSQ